MMPIWVAFTLLAARCSSAGGPRLQQKLRGQLSVNAAAVVRYLYGVPVGWRWCAVRAGLRRQPARALGGAALRAGRASGRSSAPTC
jgi:hypothetical protein